MSVFNFENWLEQNNIEAAKQVLIDHDMTTLKTLTLQSRTFGSLITDYRLITEKQLVQSIVVAIQVLDKEKNTQKQKQKKEIEEKQIESLSNDIYIIPSTKEHEAMKQIQDYIDYMKDLKSELTEMHNKCNTKKISNKDAVKRKHIKCCDELKRIKNEIIVNINKLNEQLNEKEISLKNEIKQYQNKVNQIENGTGITGDILTNYSMTINKAITHYKNKIIECKNILKSYSINDDCKYDEYHGSSTNTDREKKIVEIGQTQKKHYIDTIYEVKIYKKQIDEFLEEDLELILYKTKSNINSDATVYSIHVNKEIYDDITRNIDSFISFSETNQLSAKQAKSTVPREKHFLSQSNELQITINKQKQQIVSLNKEIDQLTQTLEAIKKQ